MVGALGPETLFGGDVPGFYFCLIYAGLRAKLIKKGEPLQNRKLVADDLITALLQPNTTANSAPAPSPKPPARNPQPAAPSPHPQPLAPSPQPKPQASSHQSPTPSSQPPTPSPKPPALSPQLPAPSPKHQASSHQPMPRAANVPRCSHGVVSERQAGSWDFISAGGNKATFPQNVRERRTGSQTPAAIAKGRLGQQRAGSPYVPIPLVNCARESQLNRFK